MTASPAPLRILTFNWHEAYICMLAKTRHAVDVVERLKGGRRVWFYETRPLPANVRIVKEATARRTARDGAYDAIICHNLQDLRWAAELPTARVLVFHNKLKTEIALGGHTVDSAAYRRDVTDLVDRTADLQLVFISPAKQSDWDLPGHVTLPGIDLEDYAGYDGDETRVLSVGNFMPQRDLMLGYSTQRQLLRGLPWTLLGLNPPETGARFTRSWEDLKHCFRSHRAYLNTTVDGYEDGYNLAMLEAMATGMPVVSTANASSPISDGTNGFVSNDLPYLSRQLRLLLERHELARGLGQAARETVGQEFPIAAFVERWNAVLDLSREQNRARRAAGGVEDRSPIPRGGGTSDELASPRRAKVLLAYVSYPATTARYLETSLRRAHDVLTVGPAIGDRLVKEWKLEGMGEPIVPHDLPCPPQIHVDRITAALPAGWQPDLFLWVESVSGFLPEGIPTLGCPTACYLVDSHLNLEWHLDWATRFDWVFVAQREYLGAFRRAGCARVVWLPLGCEPAIHGRVDVEKCHDVGFVGSLTDQLVRRRRLLDRLGRRVSLHVERSFFRDMARTFSASKIVFNDAVKDDLNMRVFEALASGSMLLTDRAPGSGLEEMFRDREHLVIYDEDNLEDLAEYYLAHERERERIAARGRAEALRWHTYDHRAASLIETVSDPTGAATLEPFEDEIDDPVLLEAIALANARQPQAALDALTRITSQRELSAWEQFQRHQVVAGCRRQTGRDEAAAGAAFAAMRGLPAAERAAAITLLTQW